MVVSLPSHTDADDCPVTLIKPQTSWVSLNLRELWAYRELLFYMIWRDITVRYKQTVLGATWAILNPLFSMVVLTVIFGTLVKIDSEGLPYPLFSYSALLPWTFFVGGLSRASGSVLGSANLIKKVYFPRLIVPISAVIGGLPDFFLSFVILIMMMIGYGVYPTLISLVWLPLCLLVAMITALGVGLWLGALNTQYRDVRYIVPVLTQFWMYATPVVYPTSLLPDRWHFVYSLNPMVGVIEGFRWSLLHSGNAPGPMMLVSGVMAVLVLISGAFYFRRMESVFADII